MHITRSRDMRRSRVIMTHSTSRSLVFYSNPTAVAPSVRPICRRYSFLLTTSYSKRVDGWEREECTCRLSTVGVPIQIPPNGSSRSVVTHREAGVSNRQVRSEKRILPPRISRPNRCVCTYINSCPNQEADSRINWPARVSPYTCVTSENHSKTK